MTRARRILFALAGAAVCLAAQAALAQDRPADDMERLREKLRADKKAVVVSALELTEGEARAFWPVYNMYQSTMHSHNERVLNLIEAYAKSYDTMTDATATNLLTQYLALERDHLALLTSYLPRFQKVLPPRKVLRLYQVENKARAVVNYELARSIPLGK